MVFTQRWRRLTLLSHIVSSVGWMGAVALYIGLAIAVMASQEPLVVRGALSSMRISVWYAIIPFAALSLTTGLIIGVGTIWGLFRHYWVIFKLVLNLLGITVLVLYTSSINHYAELALSAETPDSIATLRNPTHLVHSTGGLIILLAAAVLSVYKPKGMTRYGRQYGRPPQRKRSDAPALSR